MLNVQLVCYQIKPTQAYTQTIDVRNNRYKQKHKQTNNFTT